jgi:hypothetical protein
VPAALALALALATPVATWWLVGDQSTVPVSAGRDDAFRPLDISPFAERAAGIGSLVLAVGMMVLLVRATRRQLLDPRWWSVPVPLLGAGFVAGSAWRVLTAGVIGANIGAGFALVLGGPVIAALLLWAAARSAFILARPRCGATSAASRTS